MSKNPALHNAMWPGLVGKGGPGAEPPIDLDTMLNLTEAASVDGVKFDGVDLFLFDPHVSIDSTNDDLQRLAEKIQSKHLMVGSLVAPVWPPTGGGSAMGSEEERKAFLTQVRKACTIGRKLEDFGARRYGIVRIDSATSPTAPVAQPPLPLIVKCQPASARCYRKPVRSVRRDRRQTSRSAYTASPQQRRRSAPTAGRSTRG